MTIQEIMRQVEEISTYSEQAGMAQAVMAENAADIHRNTVGRLKGELQETLKTLGITQTTIHIPV